MSLVEKEATYFFTSSERLGAQNKDNDGSRFQLKLSRPIEVPNTAIDISMEITSANIWFTTPNINEKYENNKIYINYDDGVNQQLFVFTIPDGLYSVASLNETIEHLVTAENVPGTTEKFLCTSIIFGADTATQRVKIKLDLNLSIITDPAQLNNIASTLGWYDPLDPLLDIGPIGPAAYTGQIFTAPEIAKLNKINSYLIHGDIVKNGIQVNNVQANILTEIQLNVPAGKLLTYRPYRPYKLDGTHLKYGVRDLLTFWITNELNEYIDMYGEDWSFAITVTYKVDINHIMTQGRIPSA